MKRGYVKIYFLKSMFEAQGKRTPRNAKQMQNTKRNCFSQLSESPQNDKQCFSKQCFANQTNIYPAGFTSLSG